MTLDESVHGMRLRVIERAQVLGNVSAVCREQGISRTLFYRWRQRLERYGVDGVHPRRTHGRAGRPVTTAPAVERLVLKPPTPATSTTHYAATNTRLRTPRAIPPRAGAEVAVYVSTSSIRIDEAGRHDRSS